jgi:hypothetical protein
VNDEPLGDPPTFEHDRIRFDDQPADATHPGSACTDGEGRVVHDPAALLVGRCEAGLHRFEQLDHLIPGVLAEREAPSTVTQDMPGMGS